MSVERRSAAEDGAWSAWRRMLESLRVEPVVIEEAYRRLLVGRAAYGPQDPQTDTRDLVGKETREEALDIVVYQFLAWQAARAHGQVPQVLLDRLLRQALRAAQIAKEAQ